MQDLVFEKSIAYLKVDSFKHLATLKHLSLYHDKLTLNLVEEAPHWAILVTIPTALLSYDTTTYPKAHQALFLNGTSPQLKYQLLDTLPKDHYILRLNEDIDLIHLENRFKITAGNSFISYSCTSVDRSLTDSIVPGNTIITDEAIDLIKRNGYCESEIRKHFDNGAVWFGLTLNNKIRSICFIYRNYGDIWEIAGVHTLETERNKGYARQVVISALTYIFERNRIPRYEADVLNLNSLKLAQSLKMKQFLRINHFLLSPL